MFKKGEKYDPANYRPVSLTSVCCKVLEHILTSTIMSHLEYHGILCSQQHGFRKKRSCETQLLELTNELFENMEGGKQTDILVLDFAKALDKVNPSLLSHKLHYYGIRRGHQHLGSRLPERQNAGSGRQRRAFWLRPSQVRSPAGLRLGALLVPDLH